MLEGVVSDNLLLGCLLEKTHEVVDDGLTVDELGAGESYSMLEDLLVLVDVGLVINDLNAALYSQA